MAEASALRLGESAGLTAAGKPAYAAVVTLAVVLGSAVLLPMWISILRMWATDPLRSIGAVFPPLALAGVLLRWRERGWAAEGTWWGLPVVLAAIPLSRVVSLSKFDVNVEGGLWGLMHLGPALFLYGVGAVLLFGGTRLLRAALAPLCLLLAIDPVPHAFNALADMPLQQLSAHTARGFAHAIGLQPTGEQLRMMFAPDFGMLIVPGCNGVRGSVTLGYLTLIFGYTRRLRPALLTAVAAAALLLGYLLNLLRLCLLVIFYRVGLSLPSIQKHGEGADYAIGCTLFLLATIAIGLGVRALAPKDAVREIKLQARADVEGRAWGKMAAFAAAVLLFLAPEVHAWVTMPPLRPDEAALLRIFPAQAGPFRLLRTHAEHGGGGAVVLGLGEYEAPPLSSADSPRTLTLGLWVGPGNHMVAQSRVVQGVEPRWTGSFEARSRTGQPVHLASAMYDDGVTLSLDAETVCTFEACTAQLAGGGGRGFLFMGPRLRDLLFPPTGARLAILFERTWPRDPQGYGPSGPNGARTQFAEDATLFTQELDVPSLVRQAGSRP